MRTRTRGEGFTRLGELGPRALGFPERRERELLLRQAWADVAGEALASRVAAVEIRRGVLEVAAPDERWAEVLIEVLPRLAARLAARYPALGVRRFRVRRGKVEGLAVIVAAEEPLEGAAFETGPLPRPAATVEPEWVPAEAERRLLAAAERCLERSGKASEPRSR